MELITTYPAAVNSKATVTMGVLDQATTIVEVLDATVLPEAPNLLVLGTDQTAETVLMTARENNTLTIQRAVQGIAKSWPAGTQIARNFTGKDWDDMRSNVEAIVTKILGLTASDVGALAKIALISDGEYDNKNIDTLGDGVYLYNGWAQAKLICSAGLPFINKTGLWIKKTRHGENGGSDRVDFVINNETGEFFTMYAYNGTWHSGKDLFLPLDGSVPMSGALKMEGSSLILGKESEWGSGHYSSINQDPQNVRIMTRYNGIAREYFFGDASKNLAETIRFYDASSGVGKYYNIFGEHNKPSGSYTGNGSATSRTINIASIGAGILIISDNGMAIVTSAGAIMGYGTTISGLGSGTVTFKDGVLTLKTADNKLNANGVYYDYQVF